MILSAHHISQSVAYLILLCVGLGHTNSHSSFRRPSLEEARLRLRLSRLHRKRPVFFSSSFFFIFPRRTFALQSTITYPFHLLSRTSYPTCLPRRLFRSPLPRSRPPPCSSTESSRRSPSLTTRASGEYSTLNQRVVSSLAAKSLKYHHHQHHHTITRTLHCLLHSFRLGTASDEVKSSWEKGPR